MCCVLCRTAWNASLIVNSLSSLSPWQIGPQRPLQTAESQAALRENLRKTMSAFEDEPPFTIQRLCEV